MKKSNKNNNVQQTRVKIVSRDSRHYEGDLLSIDECMNILLNDTEEFLQGDNKTNRRYLGLVFLRGGFVSSLEYF